MNKQNGPLPFHSNERDDSGPINIFNLRLPNKRRKALLVKHLLPMPAASI